MKKSIKFLFAAFAATAMLFSSCSKDEKNDEKPDEKPQYNNTEKIVVSAPEVVYPKQYQYVGLATTIDFKWEKPSVKKVSHIYDENTKSYIDTETELTDCSFKYELCYFKDDSSWETSEKISETEFSKNVTLEEGKKYYYKINTYISYGNTKDSLIERYECKFSDDVEIPFYSTYQQKHHIGVIKSVDKVISLAWDKGCDCKLTYCEVQISDKGKYTYKEYLTETWSPTDEHSIEMGLIRISGENVIVSSFIGEDKIAVKYELSGKYNETGTLHLYAVDGTKYISDGDFNVYDKINLMNTDQQCAVFPKGAKNIYLEPMFEYSESGRLKRYNPNTYQGRIVTYEDWSKCAEKISEPEFNMYIEIYLGVTYKDNQTYPFIKNGEYMCFDNQMISWKNYESKNFNGNCCLIELMDKQE